MHCQSHGAATASYTGSGATSTAYDEVEIQR
jgi:hypothetical protein